MRRWRPWLLVFSCVLNWKGSGQPQSPGHTLAPTAPTSTLKVNSRLVLVDITVTDAHGNPVHGLTRPEFEVLDNNRPQKISTFEEHAETPKAAYQPATTEPGSYSNDVQIHPPPVFNLILIDTNTLDMAPQIYLYDQLNRLIDELRPNQPVAIYDRWGDYTMLVQDFTTDHDLLHKAVRKAIPRLRVPGHATYSDIDTLKQVLSYIRTIPGRKNVLWFNGGSNAFLRPPPTYDSNLEPEGERQLINQLRDMYDELEAARVSLYPIDARGLVNLGPDPDQNRTRFEQHSLSSDMAQATGGRAYSNDNGLRQIAEQVITDDASYYTLTYSPDDLHLDNKWHKIKVKVEGHNYDLSYRRGYFDDGVNGAAKPAKRDSRTLLHANGKTQSVPDNESEPIVFRTRILPSKDLPMAMVGQKPNPPEKAPKHGETTYTVHYTVPLNEFVQGSNGRKGTLQVGAAVMTFDQYGGRKGWLSQTLHLSFNEPRSKNSNAQIAFDQSVNLPKGNDTLFLVLWDASTGRVGSMQIPVSVR
jgi:VWFA-related protein